MNKQIILFLEARDKNYVLSNLHECVFLINEILRGKM